jgi:hypothetical protein
MCVQLKVMTGVGAMKLRAFKRWRRRKNTPHPGHIMVTRALTNWKKKEL